MAPTAEEGVQHEISAQGPWPRWPAPCRPAMALQPRTVTRQGQPSPSLQGFLSQQGFNDPVEGKALPPRPSRVQPPFSPQHRMPGGRPLRTGHQACSEGAWPPGGRREDTPSRQKGWEERRDSGA